MPPYMRKGYGKMLIDFSKCSPCHHIWPYAVQCDAFLPYIVLEQLVYSMCKTISIQGWIILGKYCSLGKMNWVIEVRGRDDFFGWNMPQSRLIMLTSWPEVQHSTTLPMPLFITIYCCVFERASPALSGMRWRIHALVWHSRLLVEQSGIESRFSGATFIWPWAHQLQKLLERCSA